MDQPELPYQVKIENFEGPLDLLLHLIKKNEINIYDIPIALIAQQYLDYLSVMKELNLAVAGEFLVMAATLLHIKSRMLLPSDEVAVDEEEGPDPREELVRRLLEYKQFKEAASQLDYQERLWRDTFGREPAPLIEVAKDESLLDEISLFDLVDALQGVLSRHPGKRLVEIIPDNLTVRSPVPEERTAPKGWSPRDGWSRPVSRQATTRKSALFRAGAIVASPIRTITARRPLSPRSSTRNRCTRFYNRACRASQRDSASGLPCSAR